MKLTINECLKLDAFKGAKVVAGKRNLGNKVNGISVLEPIERADVKEFVDGRGQVLLTGFFATRHSPEKQIGIIAELATKDVAALVVFFVGKVVPALDANVIETAERMGLPLIVMPRNEYVDYSEVIDAVMEKLLYGDNFSNNLISNTIFHLLDFEKHTSFQDALMAAAVNSGFQIIILSDDFNPILSVETRHKATISDAIRIGKEREIAKDKSPVYTMIDVNGVLTYWGPVTINGDKHFMFIVDNEDSYTAGEITKLAEIIEIAMSMWKYTPERDAKSECVKALRRGNTSLARSVMTELGVSEDNLVGVFIGRGIDNKDSLKEVLAFEAETELEVISISDNEETCGLIINSTDPDRDFKFECMDLFANLKGRDGVKIFNVIGIDGIEGAANGYKLIGEAWSFAQKVYPYKRVFTKYELTLVSNCIMLQLQGGFVKDTYLKLVKVFDDVGGNKGRQLLDTLETFVLDAGINSNKTATLMNIHPNTVQYRLKKINELLGVEITGNRIIPGITIALALKRIERVVN